MNQSKTRLPLQNKYFILFISFSLVLWGLRYSVIPKESKYDRNETTFIGEIQKITQINYNIRIELLAKERLIVYYQDFKSKEDLKVGDIIKVKGKLEEIEEETIPNLYSYKNYYRSKDCFYNVKAKSIEKLGVNRRIETLLEKQIERSKKSAPYLKAFFMGTSEDISSFVKNSYQQNGISHLFCFSGMHVGIILNLLKKVPILKGTILIFYLLLLRDSPSFLRAFLLVVISYLLTKRNLKAKNYQKTMIAICILLYINPFFVDQIGFWFSCVISLGLTFINKKNNISKIRQIIKTSFYAFVFSIPILQFFFYEVNWLTPIWNLFFVPFFTFLLVPLFIITLFFPILDPITNCFIVLFEKISLQISNFETGVILTGKPTLLTLLFLIMLIIGIIICQKNRKIQLLFICLLFLQSLNPFSSKQNEFVFLDVGQGDATYFQIDGKNVLLDTGMYQGEKIIQFLKSKKVKKLEYLILSHGDQDHIGNVQKLINDIKIKNIIFNIGEYNHLELQLIKILKTKNITYYQNVENLNIGKETLYFLNTKDYNDENENSNVIYTEINNTKMLFMGDAGIEKELDILKKYNIENIDFLKVGHHGSNTSSSNNFIDKIKPKNCIISVGRNNRYGHPKENVLETLDNYCRIYRTDLNGSIELKIRKHNY